MTPKGGEIMRKCALLLAIVLVLSIPMTAYAATPRMLSIMPELTFDGTTANCSVAVIGNNTSEDIDVVIKLWRGTTCLKTWTASGDGYVFWDDTATVSKNMTYKLTVDVTINGLSKPQVYVESKCE